MRQSLQSRRVRSNWLVSLFWSPSRFIITGMGWSS
ncbi:hypothetical protein BVRB_3g048840 [Beta vulgaris subsp. vulgaris]|nr:hypothetical protein BVRB_3g048840 [Beta vulgaris subsp. vulgaris]